MSNTADDKRLGLLHNLTATWAIDLLEGRVTETYIDKEGNEQTRTLRATAAELSVIRAFLKDNNITWMDTRQRQQSKDMFVFRDDNPAVPATERFKALAVKLGEEAGRQ